MTKKEWDNLDKRNLSEKAQNLVSVSDQSLFDNIGLSDIDITDINGINKLLESIADEYKLLEV